MTKTLCELVDRICGKAKKFRWEVGHMTPSIGWLNINPRSSSSRLVGSTSSLASIGWSKYRPSARTRKADGSLKPLFVWWTEVPSASSCNDSGYTVPSMGWLKLSPSLSCCRPTGHYPGDQVIKFIDKQDTCKITDSFDCCDWFIEQIPERQYPQAGRKNHTFKRLIEKVP